MKIDYDSYIKPLAQSLQTYEKNLIQITSLRSEVLNSTHKSDLFKSISAKEKQNESLLRKYGSFVKPVYGLKLVELRSAAQSAIYNQRKGLPYDKTAHIDLIPELTYLIDHQQLADTFSQAAIALHVSQPKSSFEKAEEKVSGHTYVAVDETGKEVVVTEEAAYGRVIVTALVVTFLVICVLVYFGIPQKIAGKALSRNPKGKIKTLFLKLLAKLPAPGKSKFSTTYITPVTGECLLREFFFDTEGTKKYLRINDTLVNPEEYGVCVEMGVTRLEFEDSCSLPDLQWVGFDSFNNVVLEDMVGVQYTMEKF